MPADFVAWTPDGHLVVVDVATGARTRELASVRSIVPVIGPASVTISRARGFAVVSWRASEPGCGGFVVGTVALDGFTGLTEWGAGVAPAISPDGRRVAWLEPNASNCAVNAVIIRDVDTGEQHPIAITSAANGIGEQPGPWWTSDSRSIILRTSTRAFADSTAHSASGLIFDASTASRPADGAPIDVACLATSDDLTTLLPDGTGVMFVHVDDNATRSTVSRCTVGAKRTNVLRVDGQLSVAVPDTSGRHLLLLDADSNLRISTDGGPPTPINASGYWHVAW